MQREERGTEYGAVKIHKNVVAQIAGIAAREVDGVSRISYDIWAKIVHALTGGKIKKEPVRIEFKDNNEISITVSIVVTYGVNVPTVAINVQENIKKAVERLTGLYPAGIHVKVKGVEVKT